jgi:hypothetical protein
MAFEIPVGTNILDEEIHQYFPPGTYAAALHTCGSPVGYQFVHPLKWFQIESAKRGDHRDARTEGHRSIRPTEPAQPATESWPNDRLLQFWDFQVFPHVNPQKFYGDNNKVSPKLIIAVTKAGVIQREKLDEALEKLLHWRIYYNGRLVEQGSATDDLHHAAARGVGTYAAFVGVEGPNGFMPVCNFLQFPLFPERDGSLVVLPSAADGEGVPDFLVDSLAPDQMTALRATEPWPGKRDPYNKATIYAMDAVGPVADAKKRSRIALWCTWAYEVDLANGALVPGVGSIRMVMDAR